MILSVAAKLGRSMLGAGLGTILGSIGGCVLADSGLKLGLLTVPPVEDAHIDVWIPGALGGATLGLALGAWIGWR